MSNLKVKIKAGSDHIKYKSLFSYDSRFLFVPSGTNIKVFTTATGERLRDLIGHRTTVISVQQNPKNRCGIYSCSEDGEVICWDYEDSLILKTYKMNFQNPIKAFYIPYKEFSWYVTVKQNNEDFYRLFHVPVSDDIKKKRFLLKPVLPKQNCVSFGPKEEYVASINDNNLRVLHIASNSFKRHLTGTRKLTCIACHPSELILATGDDSGRILIWNDFLKSNHPSKSEYHWHTVPVNDLIFSIEGSYLYSGGGECVLVKWKIGTEVRHFLPRMGSAIKYLTISRNAYVASSHVDNGIYLINNQTKIERIFQGLTQNCMLDFTGSMTSNILLYDPKNHALILKGKPGCLQFYNPDEDRNLFSINVTGENHLPQDRKESVINTIIDKVDIDNEGMWLATAEYWDDGEMSPRVKLKFWQFIEESQKYQLNTNIIRPHEKRILTLKFQPPTESRTPLAVTVSEDKYFKLWIFCTGEDDEEKSRWDCFYEGYHCELMPNDAAFSQDGTILAVGFEDIITLWEPEKNLYRTKLVNGYRDDIQEMLFGRDSHSHLLVCLLKEKIRVWNLLSLRVSTEIKIRTCCLTVDPMSGTMAVFSKNNKLFVFTPNNSKYIYSHIEASTEKVIKSVFFPRKTQQEEGWQKHSQLYYMNEKQELITLVKEMEFERNPCQLTSPRYEALTPFARLVAENNIQEPVQMPDYKPEDFYGKDMMEIILSVSSHLMPSPIIMFSALMESALPRKERNESNDEDISISDLEIDDNSKENSKQCTVPKKNSFQRTDDSKENSKQCTVTKTNDSKKVDLKSIAEENYDWLEV